MALTPSFPPKENDAPVAVCLQILADRKKEVDLLPVRYKKPHDSKQRDRIKDVALVVLICLGVLGALVGLCLFNQLPIAFFGNKKIATLVLATTIAIAIVVGGIFYYRFQKHQN